MTSQQIILLPSWVTKHRGLLKIAGSRAAISTENLLYDKHGQGNHGGAAHKGNNDQHHLLK